MIWIGQKKIAFVPLYRTNAAPPDQIPPDWHNDIVRRVMFDPAPNTGADRSFRAWVRAASSGLADIDPVVLPMRTIDRQNVLPGDLEGQLGSSLRDQGFDHAALVMLGEPPAGTNAGFWSRFVMAEGTGVWVMEVMHGLTGFKDLYPFNNDTDPADRALGTFDEMSAFRLTHPCTFTKAEIGWLNPATIARSVSRSTLYDLQYIGLTQPPPSGRVAAVRIGAEVPYMMVEARKMNDQFDRGIASEGVIVYRVQTTNPYIQERPNGLLPLYLITQTALQPGQSATVDNGVIVSVTAAIQGGFTVRIEDPSLHLVDRTAEFDTPGAESPPTACVIPGLGVHNIAYRDTSGRLHELWRDANGATGTTDLTTNAGAPTAIGNPFAYVDMSRNTEILLFRGGDGTVRSLYWSTGDVGHDNLGGTAGAPKAAGDPVGYYVASADAHHVIYRSGDGHLHELNWIGVAPVVYGGNLTGAISAPTAAGDPSAFSNAAGVNIVVYRSTDRRILSVYWTEGPSGLDDLSGVARTPPAVGDPVAYYTSHDDTHQVVYLGNDGHLWELYWQGVTPVVGWDLTAPSGAPPVAGTPAAYYSAGTNTKHVIYRSADGRLHEIWWTAGGGTPAHVDITERYGIPLAADRPAAFTVEGPNTQHVAYRGTDKHIYEVIW